MIKKCKYHKKINKTQYSLVLCSCLFGSFFRNKLNWGKEGAQSSGWLVPWRYINGQIYNFAGWTQTEVQKLCFCLKFNVQNILGKGMLNKTVEINWLVASFKVHPLQWSRFTQSNVWRLCRSLVGDQHPLCSHSFILSSPFSSISGLPSFTCISLAS